MENLKNQIKLNAENKLFREMVILYDQALNKPKIEAQKKKIQEEIELQERLKYEEKMRKSEQYKLMLEKAKYDLAVHEIVMQNRLRQKKQKVLGLIKEVKRIGFY